MRPHAVALAGLLLLGCASQPREREINHLASALTKLAAAVDASIRFKRPAENLTEDQLLEFSTAHDPALLQPFQRMNIRVLRDGRSSAVLICEANTGKPLLEDAGCTAEMDVRRWEQPARRCKFSLNLRRTCAQ